MVTANPGAEIATTELSRKRTWMIAPPDGLIASLLLSFMATAGLFYVNIMSALIVGLVDGLKFSQSEAGTVASANVYGAALGALVAVFVVKRIAWRPLILVLFVTLIAIDFASTILTSSTALIPLRFVHGFFGGLSVGVAFAVIARTKNPDRTFGMLLIVQFGLGGLGVMMLPPLVPVYGPQVLFFGLAAFTITALVMTFFLDNYRQPAVSAAGSAVKGNGVAWVPLGVTLIAVFLFQAGNMGLGAYIFGLGRHYGLSNELINPTLGIAGWIGAMGAILVILLGTRIGRAVPLALAMGVTLAGTSLFWASASETAFIAANIVTAITWAFVMPYLLGMCAEFDKAGQMAALGGFFSKMGLATGPLAGAYVLDEANFPLLTGAAVGTLALCSVAAIIPAWILDRKSRAV